MPHHCPFLCQLRPILHIFWTLHCILLRLFWWVYARFGGRKRWLMKVLQWTHGWTSLTSASCFQTSSKYKEGLAFEVMSMKFRSSTPRYEGCPVYRLKGLVTSDLPKFRRTLSSFMYKTNRTPGLIIALSTGLYSTILLDIVRERYLRNLNYLLCLAVGIWTRDSFVKISCSQNYAKHSNWNSHFYESSASHRSEFCFAKGWKRQSCSWKF